MLTIEVEFENMVDGFCFFKAFMETSGVEIDDFWVDDANSIRIVVIKHSEEVKDGE